MIPQRRLLNSLDVVPLLTATRFVSITDQEASHHERLP